MKKLNSFEIEIHTFIEKINKEIPYDFSVSFEKSCYQMLPTCNRNNLSIEYSRNTLVFLLLSEIGTAEIRSRFYIQNILAKNHFFDEARAIVEECVSYIENNISQIRDKHISNIMFQSRFLLFHEIGHCILSKDIKLRNIYSDYVKSVLNERLNEYTLSQLIAGQRSLLPKWISDFMDSNEIILEDGIKESFSKIETLFLSPSNTEELLCDTYSLMTLFPVFEKFRILKESQVPYLANDLFRMTNNMGTYLYYSNYVFNDSRIPNIVTPITGMRIMIIYTALIQIISTYYPKYIYKFKALNGSNIIDIEDLLFDSEKLNECKSILERGSNRQINEKSKRYYDNVMQYLYNLILSPN